MPKVEYWGLILYLVCSLQIINLENLSTSLLFQRSERFSHKLCFPLVDAKSLTQQSTVLLTQKKKGVGGALVD